MAHKVHEFKRTFAHPQLCRGTLRKGSAFQYKPISILGLAMPRPDWRRSLLRLDRDVPERPSLTRMCGGKAASFGRSKLEWTVPW